MFSSDALSHKYLRMSSILASEKVLFIVHVAQDYPEALWCAVMIGFRCFCNFKMPFDILALCWTLPWFKGDM